MAAPIRVALIGDFDQTVTAHRAIPRALQIAAQMIGVEVDGCWLATQSIRNAPGALLPRFEAVWCVPASPYVSTAGALHAIRRARENNIPFLGTCGGFQHAVLEFTHNVIGQAEATHAELEPSDNAVIEPLTCALVEVTANIRLAPESILAQCYEKTEICEAFHCSYGLNEQWRGSLEEAGMQFTGVAEDGTVRAFELQDHPFFVGTLFQPERAALRDEASPPVSALLQAALARREIPARH